MKSSIRKCLPGYYIFKLRFEHFKKSLTFTCAIRFCPYLCPYCPAPLAPKGQHRPSVALSVWVAAQRIRQAPWRYGLGKQSRHDSYRKAAKKRMGIRV